MTTFCLASIVQYCPWAVPSLRLFSSPCYLAVTFKTLIIVYNLTTITLFCKIMKSLWVDNSKQDGKENSLNLWDLLALAAVLPSLGCTTTRRLYYHLFSLYYHPPASSRSTRSSGADTASPEGFRGSGYRDYQPPRWSSLPIAKSDRDFGFSRQGFCLHIWDFLGSWPKTRIFFCENWGTLKVSSL